jgi:hypothetical protein
MTPANRALLTVAVLWRHACQSQSGVPDHPQYMFDDAECEVLAAMANEGLTEDQAVQRYFDESY